MMRHAGLTMRRTSSSHSRHTVASAGVTLYIGRAAIQVMDAILAYLMSDHSKFVEPQAHGLGFFERPFALHHLQYFQLRVFERDEQIRAPLARGAAIGH